MPLLGLLPLFDQLPLLEQLKGKGTNRLSQVEELSSQAQAVIRK